MFSIKNIIIQKETDAGVSQWHFGKTKSLFFIITIVFLSVILIFISAEFLSDYLYEQRISEFRSNYNNVSLTIEKLHKKIKELDKELQILEEKDSAIRAYAGMPDIDRDIRKLGVGGYPARSGRYLDNLAPAITNELAALELDIEKISREINLELSSYSSIYKKVQENIHRISKIPSIRPVEGGYLNSTFGFRNDPIDNVRRFHHGQDITVKTGTPVLAPADGVVKRAYYAGGFGNHIKIKHESGYTTLFAHLSKIKVKHGQKVKRGEIIGLTGNTGRSTAPHLHYEIHYNGEPQNPLDYFFSEIRK